MSHQYLDWITDEDLFMAIQAVYSAYRNANTGINLDRLTRNVVDPFTFLFETQLVANLDPEDWIAVEARRQSQKTLSNAVGNFHQTILGSVDGWIALEQGHSTGLDIMKEDETVFAELKNKFSTLKGDTQNSIFEKLRQTADGYPQSICYLVHIVRQRVNPYDELWCFTHRGQRFEHPRVRLISGENFYSIVAGRGALGQLIDALPDAVCECIPDHNRIQFNNEVAAIADLRQQTTESTSIQNVFRYFARLAYRGTDEIENP